MTAWLVTWLWQGLALTLVMSVAFRILPGLNAAIRYWLWWCTLGALVTLGALGAHFTHLTHLTHPTHLVLIPSAPGTLITIVFGVWLAIALALLVRVVPGIHGVFRLRDRCEEFPRDVEAQLPLWLEARDPGGATRRPRLMLCDAVRGATVLGFHRPCIALPTSLLKALTRGELDQIVLHEHAHVQRWDDWTRLAQMFLQSALWIHPAMAIIGRRLDLEREMACDEWVVARTGLPKAFARCLTRAAEVRGGIGMEPALGPALFTRRHDLVHRVNRLLAVRGRTRRNVSVLGVAAGACTLMMGTIQLRAIPLVGELAEIAPAVTVRLTAFAKATSVKTPDTTSFTNLTNLTNPRTSEPEKPASAPDGATTDKPDEPHEPHEPLSLSGRSFHGHYVVAELPAPAPERRAPWQLAGVVGAEIGASARKTSVEIANTFTRAGVSLARRF